MDYNHTIVITIVTYGLPKVKDRTKCESLYVLFVSIE